LVQSADVVLLPYDSLDQVTSGVLIEAVAAGKPVVATRFPHAVELLSSGAGIVVTHRNPEEIAVALRTVITQGELAAAMARSAAQTAPMLSWAAVADQYRSLAARLITASIAA
jgi:glycosyltransferase involved in cell wall biosynthesis